MQLHQPAIQRCADNAGMHAGKMLSLLGGSALDCIDRSRVMLVLWHTCRLSMVECTKHDISMLECVYMDSVCSDPHNMALVHMGGHVLVHEKVA